MKDPQISGTRIEASALISPGAHVHGDVTVGAESFVLFGVVIRAELDSVVIGAQTNIQDNAVLHCDEGVPCRIGDRVTVGHAAVVHGATVGDRALIGVGAKILNRAVIGEGAWVGAASVVTEGTEIPPWTLALGAPASPRRELTEDEVRRADGGVDHYLQLIPLYREIFSKRE